MKYWKMTAVCFCLLIGGCASLATTSTPSFSISPTRRPPKIVGVAFFSGEEPFATNTRRDFYQALRQSGLFEKVYSADDLREAMDWSTKDFVTPDARRQLQQRLGLQGIFAANVSTAKYLAGGNSYVDMDLYDVSNGNKLWACHAQDDRLIASSSSMYDSTARSIQNAYKQLQKDVSVYTN